MCAAAWILAVRLVEIALAIPLFATMTSVGTVDAPPLPPARPSSWLFRAAVAPGGDLAGSDGEAPGPDTVTSNPFPVIVCDTPLSPVTVTLLP